MRDDERERTTDRERRGEPAEVAEPAKVHGDVLDDLIPRDLHEADESPAQRQPDRERRANRPEEG